MIEILNIIIEITRYLKFNRASTTAFFKAAARAAACIEIHVWIQRAQSGLYFTAEAFNNGSFQIILNISKSGTYSLSLYIKLNHFPSELLCLPELLFARWT